MAITSEQGSKQNPTPHASSRPNQTDYHFASGAAHITRPHPDLLPLNSSSTEQDFLIGKTLPEERD